MDAIVECCAGLDIHEATVLACLNSGPATKRSRKEVRTFGATRTELEEMRAWLAAAGVTLVAMESTGIYWRPVYAVLEGHFDLIVGNAQHMKNVPGRKHAPGLDPGDRREGLRVDQRSGPPRTDRPQLRATASDPRSA